MKIRTKFLAAVLAATMTLGCALTASAFTTEPKLSLQGNESSPLTLKNQAASATLTLKASDFKEVKGAKITVELPDSEKMELTGITVSDVDSENVWNLEKDVNYKASGNKITMVDVFNFDDTVKKDNLNLNLTFDVAKASIGTYKVKVSGDFADDTADKVYPVTANANLVIGREETTATNLEVLNNSIANANDYFIPYGGAYIGDYNLPKQSDGTFIIDNTHTGDIGVLKCMMPADGKVTTFGASNSLVGDAESSIQFGSYINKITTANDTFGTLLIVSRNLPETLTNNYKQGTYENAVKCFNGDVEALLNNIITKFKSEWFDGKLHPYTYGTTKEVVYAAVVPQKTYMWRDKEVSREKLQYAVRCTGLNDSEKKAYVYTAVGYSLKGDSYAFSTEVQSASYNSLNPVNNQ